MLLLLLIVFVLAHITPPVAVAVSIMALASTHWVITLLLVILLA
jgi:hypothetical protein